MTDFDSRKGNLVIGAMLVVVGVAIALQRAGVVHWSGQWTLWPLILGGIGLARFVGSPAGEPKQGLIFLTGAAWLAVAEAGWIEIQDSWPFIVIAIGLIVALNGGPRRRWRGLDAPGAPVPPGIPGDAPFGRRHRHNRMLTPLAVLGIWIAIFAGLQVSGIRSYRDFGRQAATESSSERLEVVSVMGRSEHVSRATAFRGADVTNVMGRAEVDLRDATLAPGASASMKVFSLMGAVVLRVPPTWTVDSGAISAMGGVTDERLTSSTDAPNPSAGPAPRLVLRGVIAMGRLTIR